MKLLLYVWFSASLACMKQIINYNNEACKCVVCKIELIIHCIDDAIFKLANFHDFRYNNIMYNNAAILQWPISSGMHGRCNSTVMSLLPQEL